MGGKKKDKKQQQDYEMVAPSYAPPQGQNNQQSKQYAMNDQDENNYDISQSSHPCAVIFQLVFKILAVIAYFFLGLFLDSTFQFIAITLLNCFDFWAVKNITGRLLIGMKWQTNFREDGTEYWSFESHDYQFKSNIVDKSFFWTSQVLMTGFWLVFTILNFMTFSLFSVCLNVEGLLLSGCNLYGFYKCSKEHQNKMKNLKKNLASQGFKYMAKQQLK